MACSLCVLVVALPLALPIGAALLRAAVALANRVLGRPVDDRDYGYAVDEYLLPAVARTAVPDPGFGKAVGIVVAIGLADLAAGVALGVAGAELTRGMDLELRRLLFGTASLASGFLIQAGLLTLILPTTFPRACLVALFFLLLCVPLVMGAGWLAIVALNAVAPNMGR